MTDLSKIDFTQLKLEKIIGENVYVTINGAFLHIVLGATSTAALINDRWQLTSGAPGLTREATDELWKRTEQVDELIRQQSRRRITVTEMLVEIITSGREMTVLNNGLTGRYRFNAQDGAIEYFAKSGVWLKSHGAGRGDDIVTVLE